MPSYQKYTSIVACLIIVIVMTTITSAELNESDVELDDIIEGVSYNLSLLKNIQLEYEDILDYGRKPERGERLSTSEVSWAMQGKLEYMEVKRPRRDRPTYHAKRAFDGEKTRTYSFNSNTGLVLQGKEGKNFAGFGPKCFMFAHGPTEVPWETALRNGTAVFHGIEEVNGTPCFVVSGETFKGTKWEGLERTYKVYFSYKQGFLPLRVEHFFRDGAVKSIQEIIRCQEFSPGIWLPMEGRNYGGSRVHKDYNNAFKVIPDSVKINVEVPDDFFVIKWPPGTAIWDDVIRQGYFIEPVPEHMEDFLKLEQKQLDEALEKVATTDSLPSSPSTSQRTDDSSPPAKNTLEGVKQSSTTQKNKDDFLKKDSHHPILILAVGFSVILLLLLTRWCRHHRLPFIRR